MNHNHASSVRDFTLIPPELQRSSPRDVSLSGVGKFALAMALLMVVAGIVFVVASYISLTRASELSARIAAEGQIARASVRELRVGRGENPKHTVIYQFEADGRTHTGSTQISGRDTRNYVTGSPVVVRYLRSQPETNWLAGHEREGIPAVVVPLIVLSTLFGPAVIWWSLRRQRRLLQEGRPVIATVERVLRAAKGKQRSQRVHVSFTDLSGAHHEATMDVNRGAPEPGSQMVILYDGDEPTRVLRYPSPLWRVQLPGA